MNILKRHGGLAAVVLLFLINGWAFISATPVFEAPDEIEHTRYSQWLAVRGTFPPPDGQILGQYHQPPLYYMLLAPLWGDAAALDLAAYDAALNPAYPYEIGIAGNDNRNKYLHTADDANSPLAQQVYLFRGATLLLGVLTLIAMAGILRVLKAAPSVRYLALLSAALHPQFVFIMASVNNDGLLVALATWGLYGLLWCHINGMTLYRALWLGLLLGLLLLAKTSGFFVGLVVIVALLLHRAWWRYVPVMAGVVLVIAGGWYGRNLLLYDDLVLTQAWQVTWAEDVIRGAPVYVRQMAVERAPYAYETFWARFGAGAVGVRAWAYQAWNGLLLLGLAGMGWRIVRGRQALIHDGRAAAIVLAYGAIWLLALLYLAGLAWSGNQGRYLFGGIVIWHGALAWGWLAWLPRKHQGKLAALIGLVLAGLMAVSWLDLRAAYRVGLPADAQTVIHYDYVRAGERLATLVGITPSITHAQVGDLVTVTLHWQAHTTPEVSLNTFLHGIKLDGTSVNKAIGRDSYPGLGNYLVQDWQADVEWTEAYQVRIRESTEAQHVYNLLAGLYVVGGDALSIQAADGTPIDLPIVGQVVVHGAQDATLPAALYTFGEAIGATEPRIGMTDEGLQVCLTWLALADVADDYRVFVHVLDADGSIMAQADGVPRNGNYPTRYWRANESIADCRTIGIDEAAAVNRIAFGLYAPDSGVRLPVTRGGTLLPDGRVVVGVK